MWLVVAVNVGCETPVEPAARPAHVFEHVLLISVDGMRPELLQAPIVERTPTYARLLRGPHTFNARTDPDITVTLPNHVSMATGRLFAGPNGHGWLENKDPPKAGEGGTIAEMHGEYVPSMFDVANDHGFATALIASKKKFVLFDQSYDEVRGALDTHGVDDGRDKIDAFIFQESSQQVARATLAFLRAAGARGGGSLSFVHFAETDTAGHTAGWDFADETLYRKAALSIDSAIGEIMQGIDADAALRGHVAIILTSDHGGGGVPVLSHTDAKAAINFTIPFAIWLAQDQPASDLYELNASTRTRPAADSNPSADAAAPIRNADAGNAALMLLGLPAIPKSSVNAGQNLRVTASGGTTKE